MDENLVTTTFGFDGYKVVRQLGIVRGVTVRSRGLAGQIGAGIQSLVGGKISFYVELCEETRQEAYEIMMKHAQEKGANGIIGMRYDATELAENMTEVLCYGTAVLLEPMA
ncbi:MAG: heavy metal-binding domain-containing protein [Chloroflexi bacterium]|nr:heavy metal-binding domain-containing protein [Chloroflexota bacterium]